MRYQAAILIMEKYEHRVDDSLSEKALNFISEVHGRAICTKPV